MRTHINKKLSSLHLLTILTYACHRSIVNYKLQDFHSALSDAENSLILDPEWKKGFHRRALALLKLDRKEEAQAVYKEALKLYPRDKKIKYYLEQVTVHPLFLFLVNLVHSIVKCITGGGLMDITILDCLLKEC